MRRHLRPSLRALAGLAGLLAGGCAGSRPAPADAAPPTPVGDVARGVVLCTTTEADLRRALGAPTRDGRLGDRRVLSWIAGEGAVVHYLAVLLDARGVVVDLYWDLPTEIPWTPTDRCAAR